MKNFYLIFTSIFIICLFGKKTFAQTETDTTFFTQMNYIFANVDKSKVPYGILRDFGMEFTNIENYNGTVPLADSNYADVDAFRDVYQTLLTSRISTAATGFVSSATADSLWYIQRQPGQIVLSGLFFNYSRFKDNAAGNYTIITNNQLYDKYVGGIWQNPYQSENAFLISPPVSFYQGQSLQVILPSDLWFTNNAAGIASMQLDAGDGAGYRTLTIGQPLNINYADTGLKQWTYKLTISGAILYSHSQIVIKTDYSSGGAQMMSPMGEVFPPSPFTATKSYLGVAGKGYATIQYADNADRELRKPLIVAEGFDPGNILAPEEKFGLSSFNEFYTDATDDQGSLLIPLLKGSSQQYDIIYVDWKNGVDYLQRNAYLLETIIQWVNANKKPLNGVMQPNVVLGQSMGGVIARYALKDMENNGLDHNTRLYISDDAPHQGANVPEGYQHLARHARSLYIRTGITAGIIETVQLLKGGLSPLLALSLADQPASKQMLINFVTGSNTIDNTVHAAWETELKNIGYPNGFSGTPFRKVAVSNGSECANPQSFNAGDNLLTYNGKANTRILSDLAGIGVFPIAGALLVQPSLLLGVIPGRNDFNFDFAINAQADGASNQVYKGKITYTKKILWLIPVTVNVTNRSYSSSASTLPYDYFPGGYYNLKERLDLNSSANQTLFYKYNITASNQPSFNFVPTVSALDIGGGNVTLIKTDYLTRYIGATPPAAPKNTPFQNFITAFNDSKINEQHISIERRNGDWIAAELNVSQPSADCSANCQDFQISGSNSICTSASYSISGLPANSTIVWTVSPTGIASIVPPNNTQTVTLSRTGIGTFTLTATISNPCSPNGIIITKTITTTGSPNISGTYNSPSSSAAPLIPWSRLNPFQFNASCIAFVTNMSVPSGASITWYGYADPGVYWYQTGKDIFCNFTAIGQTARFSAYITNACGTSQASYDFKCTTMGYCGVTPLSVGGGGIMLSPNPANNNLQVSLSETGDNSMKKSIYEIQVVDKSGNTRQTNKYGKNHKNINLDISRLKPDVYTIRVFDGDIWRSEKFIKL